MTYTTKRRNSDKRKEKSRDAARCRRGKEAEIFTDLSTHLPLPETTISQLDKASIMRMVISVLRINKIMAQRQSKGVAKLEVPEQFSIQKKVQALYPKAIEGFFIVISKDGDIIYVTESIAKWLGLQQIDLMGQSIFEFAHPCDHDEIVEMLTPHQPSGDVTLAKREAFIRLKCTLTNKGRIVNLKSATYKVIRFSGVYVCDDDDDEKTIVKEEMEDEEEDEEEREMAFLPHLLAIGEPVHHPSNIEVPLDGSTFTSRHSMSMKFTDCDDRIRQLIGYRHQELLGKSLYLYHHAQDSKILEKAFKDLFSKGQTTTGLYRFLAKNGGYVWLVTQATIIYHARTQKAQCVVCVHYVVSQVEEAGLVLSDVQKQSAVEEKTFMPIQLSQAPKPRQAPRTPQQIPQVAKEAENKLLNEFGMPELQFSTEGVFAVRTEEMDRDFYFPPGMKKGDNKNSQPDLNHLAPQDSDISIPLGFSSASRLQKVESFGTGLNLYDDFADIETKEQLLKTDFLLPAFKEEKKMNNCYRNPKQILSCSPTPVSSPRKTPSPQSSASPVASGDLNDMDKFFTRMDTSQPLENLETTEEIDFNMRAPYIPMSPDDDFSLMPPTSEALFSLGGDFNPGLFGRTESVFGPKDKLFEEPPPTYLPTMRDMLGESQAMASIERPQDTMILQMKRPLDKNSLEKGPPACKIARHQTLDTGCNSTSVLKNLLMTGEDKNHGYKVQQDISEQSGKKSLLQILMEVNKSDYEVSAPIRGNGNLLQGIDLLRALDTGTGISQ